MKRSCLGALRAVLVDVAGIAAVVGTRVYIERAPRGASMPYLLLSKIDTDPNNTLDGEGDLTNQDVDVDAKATTELAAGALADLVQDHLDGFSGAAGGITLEAFILNDNRNDFEQPEDGSEQGRHVTTLDYTVQFRG